jgi:proline iminopeptidase
MNVSSGGAEIFYTARGQGPACLVLNSMGTAPYERQLPAALDERLRMVFVDLRGSGRSTGRATDLTFDVLADDLEAVRRALGAPQVAVLGHSVLSMLAFEHGRRCPETVSHVITAGAPPFGDMARLQAAGAAYFEADASAERKQLLRENLARLPPGAPPAAVVMAQTPARFHDPHADAAPLFADATPGMDLLAHLMGTLARGWDVTAGAPLRVPTFIALGRHDYVVPHVLWDGIALPNATVHVFPQSGHQPFVEEPAAFTAAVLGWMKPTSPL